MSDPMLDHYKDLATKKRKIIVEVEGEMYDLSKAEGCPYSVVLPDQLVLRGCELEKKYWGDKDGKVDYNYNVCPPKCYIIHWRNCPVLKEKGIDV
jgi:hypothetical protein